MGTMYFADALKQGKIDKDKLFENAARSSLDAVAWGLVYPDLTRPFLPWKFHDLVFKPTTDRGQALRWRWVDGFPDLAKATLAGWAAGPGMPALVFNSTIAESGERFVFANYKTEDNLHRPVAARHVFFTAFPNNDVSIATAVSNSAAFPYVSPATRAETGAKYHLVDGGYYDNFGIASALDFLVEAGRTERPILLIQIEAGREGEYTDQAGGPWVWGEQLVAPLKGLIHMWQIAARARNEAQLQTFCQASPGFRAVRFQYTPNESPTSWHLTQPQKDVIRREWNQADNQKAAAAVRAFMTAPGQTQKTPNQDPCAIDQSAQRQMNP